MPDIRIARATFDDLPAIADIQVNVWRQAYAGIINDEYLNSLTVEGRLEKWRNGFMRKIGQPMTGTHLVFVDGIPKGFIGYGPGRDDDRKGWPEIYAIYVRQDGWQHGLGFRLFDSARTVFKEHGQTQAFLWVLDNNNRARDAYARWGGVVEPERRKQITLGEQTLDEISVRFSL